MIALLRGIIHELQGGEVILDVNGVGYRVFIPDSTGQALPPVGSEVTLHVHTHVREDAMHLYGFLSQAELRLFETVIGVSGIGPRLGLVILSHLSVDGFVRAVIGNEATELTRVPGIGKKTAARILLELKDKFNPDEWIGHTFHVPQETAGEQDTQDTEASLALEALIALGYSEREASHALKAVLPSEPHHMTAETIIRRALGTLDPTG